ncbi:hypothetical protein LTR05_002072 [Lithohypha guttulata]|uniref:Uncharacterized protein n=1 Tax=Lithohypha guttulata TaxID=1690604 RepID=A0AAN7T2Z9_9EURO|nr:hypothetical protein LTR05_002072 [Lithohypha guttulata]
MAKTRRIYQNTAVPHIDVPNVDLLTFLFDSEHSLSTPDTILHVDAAHPDAKLTKGNLSDLTQQIAHGLRTNYDVGSGGPDKDVVTVMSYGQLLIPAVFYGVIAAGGIYSAASPSSTVAELARQISVAKSNLVICSSEHETVVKDAARQCGVPFSRVLVVESWPELSLKSLEGGIDVISSQKLHWECITDAPRLKRSIIVILWSSGTTGLPKGVSLSHLNLVAETFIGTILSRMHVAKLLETDPASYTPVEFRTLGHLPISHIAGFMSYLIIPIYSAGTVFWMRKYNWTDLLKYMKEYKITAFYTVPSIYLRIAKSPEVKDHFQHVVAASTGAAPMDAKLQTSSNSRLGDGQSTFIGQTWGLSETTGAVTAIPAGQTDVTGCIGFILPNVELRMVNDNYEDVEPGQEGEFLIRAPMVMEGYFNNEQATKDAFYDFNDDHRGPWFCSGDIGVMRDGKFYIVDRKKELLKYKGLQIAPAEIENLLFTHPAVAEAAVVGIPAPDDPGTDLPRAYIVLSQASPGSSGEGDPSKLDTLEQTRYMDSKHTRSDSSKQDTLDQTRYADVRRTTSASTSSIQGSGSASSGSWPTPTSPGAQAPLQKSAGSDSSKQDTVEQTRYMDAKHSKPRNEGSVGPSRSPPSASIDQTTMSDSSKQDTLSQTRYFDQATSKAGADESGLAEELKKYVADRLAHHKQLRGGIKFVSEIPKNAIGKFLRRDLRIRAKKEMEEESGAIKAKL